MTILLGKNIISTSDETNLSMHYNFSWTWVTHLRMNVYKVRLNLYPALTYDGSAVSLVRKPIFDIVFCAMTF